MNQNNKSTFNLSSTFYVINYLIYHLIYCIAAAKSNKDCHPTPHS